MDIASRRAVLFCSFLSLGLLAQVSACKTTDALTNPELDELGAVTPTRATPVLVCPAPDVLKARFREQSKSYTVAEYPADWKKVQKIYSDKLADTVKPLNRTLDPGSVCPVFEEEAIWSDARWTFANDKAHAVFGELAAKDELKTVLVPVVLARELKCAGATLFECWEKSIQVGMMAFDAKGKMVWKHEQTIALDPPSVGDRRIKERRIHVAINVILSELPDEKLARRDLRDENLNIKR